MHYIYQKPYLSQLTIACIRSINNLGGYHFSSVSFSSQWSRWWAKPTVRDLSAAVAHYLGRALSWEVPWTCWYQFIVQYWRWILAYIEWYWWLKNWEWWANAGKKRSILMANDSMVFQWRILINAWYMYCILKPQKRQCSLSLKDGSARSFSTAWSWRQSPRCQHISLRWIQMIIPKGLVMA